MSLQWYALRVKPHKERIVCEMLEAQEMRVFYPSLKVKPKNPRSRKERPFFPGYLFVKIDLEALGMNALRWTENTYGLVQFGGVPSTVPEQLVLDLQERLIQIEEQGGLVFEDLQKGDRVRITRGPFAGYEAIFDLRLSGKDRVQILLNFLGDQPKRLQVEASEIEKIKSR